MLESALAAAHHRVRSLTAAALAPFALSVDEARILLALKSGEKPSMSVLARAAGLRLPALSKAADRLEERGLVRRIGGEEDTRRVYLALTSAGERQREAAAQALAQTERLLATRLGTWERDRLERLLDRLNSELK
jgi:DNA-binding MarR family transcriptional regulator